MEMGAGSGPAHRNSNGKVAPVLRELIIPGLMRTLIVCWSNDIDKAHFLRSPKVTRIASWVS
jgi:hypothetical protein